MHTLISAQAGCTDIDISPSPSYFIYFSIERDNQQIDLYIHSTYASSHVVITVYSKVIV